MGSAHQTEHSQTSWGLSGASGWSECCPLEPVVFQTLPSAKDEPDCCSGKETMAVKSPRKSY